MRSEHRFTWILIRGVSALAVMFGHVRGLFFVDFSFLANKSPAYRALYAITGFGHQAVIVFFVLSGYFIGTSVTDSVGERRWSWRVYLVNRLTRLQLVLLPALVLGAVWDQIGMRIPQAASFYYGGLYKYYVPSVALRSTVPVFFGNLFFLQSVVSPVFGSNGPLWSLSYEFWYYILFPALDARGGLLGGSSHSFSLCGPCGVPVLVYRPADQPLFLDLAGRGIGRTPAPCRVAQDATRTGVCVHGSRFALFRRPRVEPGLPDCFGDACGLYDWSLLCVVDLRADSRIARRCFFCLRQDSKDFVWVFVHALLDPFPGVAAFARPSGSAGELAARSEASALRTWQSRCSCWSMRILWRSSPKRAPRL